MTSVGVGSAFARSRMICSPSTTAQHATFLSGPGSARRMRSRWPFASFLSPVDPLRIWPTEAPPSLILLPLRSCSRTLNCVVAYSLPHYSCVLSPLRQHYSRLDVTPSRGKPASAASPASLLPRSSSNTSSMFCRAESSHEGEVPGQASQRPLGSLPTLTPVAETLLSLPALCRATDLADPSRRVCGIWPTEARLLTSALPAWLVPPTLPWPRNLCPEQLPVCSAE